MAFMSQQLSSGCQWHCDVRSIAPPRMMWGDSGFGQDWCDMYSVNRELSLKKSSTFFFGSHAPADVAKDTFFYNAEHEISSPSLNGWASSVDFNYASILQLKFKLNCVFSCAHCIFTTKLCICSARLKLNHFSCIIRKKWLRKVTAQNLSVFLLHIWILYYYLSYSCMVLLRYL